jgi:RNA 3'-terminal phosphate cyclase (ATP)
LLQVDGSQKSGSGTILRSAIAMAAILNEPLHIRNIRTKRPEPGLRPQHLEAVLTAAKLCHATVEGAALSSKELKFYPGDIAGGRVDAEIGTAGSIPMLLVTVLPMCAFARDPVCLHISRGGTDVLHSPTINYLGSVLFPILEKMGLRVALNITKYGYYPKGMGEVTVEAQPVPKLGCLVLEEFGSLERLEGISVCTCLADRNVARRQAEMAERLLRSRGLRPAIRVANDFSNPRQKGSSLTLWAQTNRGAILGGDAIGELRKSSEAVGQEAALNLLREVEAKATVDVHLADLLVPYVALAKGRSVFLTRTITDHLETNIWLAQKMLGVKFKTRRAGSLFEVEKTEL